MLIRNGYNHCCCWCGCRERPRKNNEVLRCFQSDVMYIVNMSKTNEFYHSIKPLIIVLWIKNMLTRSDRSWKGTTEFNVKCWQQLWLDEWAVSHMSDQSHSLSNCFTLLHLLCFFRHGIREYTEEQRNRGAVNEKTNDERNLKKLSASLLHTVTYGV